MTIAEKLVKVAENVPKVYEAGQKSMVDESKIIEKTVSGSVISLDDVSEVPHDVAVQLSSKTVTDFSGVAVKVLGKNLFDGAFEYGILVGTTGAELSHENAYIRTTNYIEVFEGVNYVISFKDYANVNMLVYEYKYDYTYNGTTNVVLNPNQVYTPSENTKYIRFRPNSYTIPIDAECQMEVGTVPTAYEPYIPEKIYIAEADGTVKGIKSISPNMTIYSDGEGVNITATYHKSWGMQTEYDRFWDTYQQNGAVLYSANYMFSSPNWVDEIYNPKYTIIPQRATAMYRFTGITDVKVDLDFTQSVIPESTGSVFANTSALKRIPKIKVLENMKYDSWFASCTSLEEIRFEGIIGNSLDIHWSTKLSMASLASIVGALSKTVTGQSITLPTTARDTYDSITYEGRWDELVAEYPNWSFKYS